MFYIKRHTLTQNVTNVNFAHLIKLLIKKSNNLLSLYQSCRKKTELKPKHITLYIHI